MMVVQRNLDRNYRALIRNVKGTSCVNCGSTESIEYHHIVPLSLGGEDRIGNIVPLCRKCHMAAHHGRRINNYINKDLPGRKPNVTDTEAFLALDLFSSGEIGAKKCKQMMRVSEKTHVPELVQYKKYLQAKGIIKIKNDVDILGVNGSLTDGEMVGYVKYTNGEQLELHFKDSGKNDVTYKRKKLPKSNFRIFKTD